jgi:hypothetical protein
MSEQPLTIEQQQALQAQLDSLYVENMFKPCKTKEALKKWLMVYLDADLTDTTIDENSTSNALEMVWSVYHAMYTGDVTKIQHVVAVARGGAKTLGAACIEILAMLHFGRNVVHCAAEEHQSKTALGYFDKMIMDNKLIQSHIGVSNKRTRKLINLPKTKHRPTTSCELQVVIATLSGVNGKRGQLIVCDELDLVKPEVLSELAYIQVPHFGLPAISIFLSSRQSASGPIQKKVDLAADPRNNITLHTWSMIDLMKRCTPEVYDDVQPKQKRYINNYTLSMIDPVNFDGLTPASQSEYTEYELNAGCVKCPIATVCRGRAINQTSTNQYLRSIVDVSSLVQQAGSPSSIIARVMNLKPESNGLVFSFFERRKHFRPIEEVWEFAFGEKPNHAVDKLVLVNMLRQCDWTINNGVDFGLVDPATSVLIAYQKNSNKLIVVNVENAIGYDNDSWLEYVRDSVYNIYGFKEIYPDLAYPVAPKKCRGLQMPCREFIKPKVEPGVSFIRRTLFNPITQKTSFMIVADSKNEFMATEFESWSYMKTAGGYLLGQYDKDGANHSLDALRYALIPFVNSSNGSSEERRAVLSATQPKRLDREMNPSTAYTYEEECLYTSNRIKDHFKSEYDIDLNPELTTPNEKGQDSEYKRKRSFRTFF